MSSVGVQEMESSAEIDDFYKMAFRAQIEPNIAFFAVFLLYIEFLMS